MNIVVTILLLGAGVVMLFMAILASDMVARVCGFLMAALAAAGLGAEAYTSGVFLLPSEASVKYHTAYPLYDDDGGGMAVLMEKELSATNSERYPFAFTREAYYRWMADHPDRAARVCTVVPIRDGPQGKHYLWVFYDPDPPVVGIRSRGHVAPPELAPPAGQ